ncbi:MAG: organoarsenical effux MFS transporter ArsJ [Lentisphaeraceae bacterium]|nr:organoarsenical effux MFS transporter ArsJ [Lentisphaeraceae bacterium]
MNKVRDYIIVTAAYWSFMLTDGALRMLTLLYFHDQGYSPVKLAFLFLLYEFCGVITNLFGGWLAQQKGLKTTLIYGLALQVISLTMLSFLDASWSEIKAVSFVMLAQALSGIAKDLTKMSSKTAVKFLVPKDQNSQLFKWVAILTGSKNAIKGAGFFFGGLLLQVWGFKSSLLIMAAIILVIFITTLLILNGDLGQAKSKNRLKELFSQGRNINLLAASRVFLFGARDIWFVVGIPIFMSEGLGWSFSKIGSFMAVWVIIYGFIQSIAPKLVKGKDNAVPDGKAATTLALLLTLSMIGLISCYFGLNQKPEVLIVGLYIFGFFFALNSSVHSFLILDYADNDKAAMNVGFYYMANAIGRLVGTLLSGVLYQIYGLKGCLVGSLVFLIICMLINIKLPKKMPA